jgi:mannose/fructose/N-acetylgalactosamine-specific phosphotransferase system component IIC
MTDLPFIIWGLILYLVFYNIKKRWKKKYDKVVTVSLVGSMICILLWAIVTAYVIVNEITHYYGIGFLVTTMIVSLIAGTFIKSSYRK